MRFTGARGLCGLRRGIPNKIDRAAGRSALESARQSRRQTGPASKIGHPAQGRIWLSVNGTMRQTGDLNEMIWNVPEIIAQLSQQVSLGAGDIIMTGTPAGVAALSPGDRIECGVDGVGTLKVSIGEPA